jgi:hypothetical protein
MADGTLSSLHNDTGSPMESVPHLRERGAKRLKEVLGRDFAEVEGTLGKLSPQAATYIIETVFGQIYQSSALDAKTRQIVTIAALATLGGTRAIKAAHRRRRSRRTARGRDRRGHGPTHPLCRPCCCSQRHNGLQGSLRRQHALNGTTTLRAQSAAAPQPIKSSTGNIAS